MCVSVTQTNTVKREVAQQEAPDARSGNCQQTPSSNTLLRMCRALPLPTSRLYWSEGAEGVTRRPCTAGGALLVECLVHACWHCRRRSWRKRSREHRD